MKNIKNKIINIFKNLENQTIRIIKNGIKGCFGICLISIFILLTYTFIYSTPLLFDIGIILFKMSLLFSIEFLICGIVVDSLKKNII